MESYSWLWLITMKGCKAKTAKRKGTWVKSGVNQMQASDSSSSGSQDLLSSSSNKLWQIVGNTVNQGSSLETRHPGFSLGADHIGTLCMEHTQISVSQKECESFHRLYCLYEQFRHKESGISVSGGNPPESKFPYTSQGPTFYTSRPFQV